MTSEFIYAQPVKIFFGRGQFEKLGAVLDELGVQRAVLVCGRHFAPQAEKLRAFPPAEDMAGLGGSLDSFAGNVKRAPKWMIRMNLEWLYRLYKEPKRIGRMMRLPKYVLRAVFTKKK